MKGFKVVGVDLAGKESNPSGIAILQDREVSLSEAYSDEEITSLILEIRPDLVAIDAPLSLPREGITRDVDKLMVSLGLRVLPPLLGGMRYLTLRGVKLRQELEERGACVIEVHPKSSLKILKLKRENFLEFLEREGFKIEGKVTQHTIDAAVSAYTALLYLTGCTKEIKGEEGVIIVPAGKHAFPRVAVDILIIDPQTKKFVLVKRLNPPFKDHWALPGGFVEYGERVEEAAIREAKEETGLDVELKELIGVYSDPDRDPRGHVISIAFLAFPKGGSLKASTDAKEVEFFSKIPSKMAFDHEKIVKDGLKKFKKYFLS